MWKRIGKRTARPARAFACTFVCAIALGCCVVGPLAVSLAGAGQEPEVSVTIDKASVILGDSVLLTVTMRGVPDASPPVLPEIPDFDVKFRGVRQEAFSSFTMIIQGQTTQQRQTGGGMMFDYELIPKRAGEFVIPSFDITAAGRTWPTKSFRIEVVEQTARSADIFLRVTSDRGEVTLGEKVLITFQWYFRTDITSYRLNIPWVEGAKNFLIQDPPLEPNRRYQRLLVNDKVQVAAEKHTEFYKGEQYAVIRFQKILTPLAAGSFTLDPAFLSCDRVTGYREGRPRSFFDDFFGSDFNNFLGMGRQAVTAPFSTRSEPLSIQVLEVPHEGRPGSFNGAVGTFDFDVSVKPERLKAGEPITVTLRVSGAGNLESLNLPVFPEIEGFRSYEPESRTNLAPGTVRGEKIFEKVLVPKKEGRYEIPVISFTFFNPAARKFETLSRGPFKVTVERPAEAEPEPPAVPPYRGMSAPAPRELQVLRQDIRYIKPELGPVEKTRRRWTEDPAVYLAAFLLPGAALAVLLLWRGRRERYVRDIRFARHKRAFRNIRSHLAAAEAAFRSKDTRKFYDALEKALTQFLADKLNRPRAAISHEIVEELEGRGLEAPAAQVLDRLFRTFESALFSRAEFEPERLRQDFSELRALLGRLERMLK